jgi:sugar O-acyltransferase (sialic acid O-acetyltransferase NeuD family)
MMTARDQIGKDRNLVIVGDSLFAEIACEYFTRESRYEVVGFAVEQAFLEREELFDRPIVAFESLTRRFPPREHYVYVAIVYTQLNRLRTRLALAAKEAGYALASFVSPHAFIWHNVKIGEHCFIFEHNVVQPFATVGDNVVLWSGNHIGHHSRVGNNVFISSHVVISGLCEVGDNCFFGVNSSVSAAVHVAENCWIGPNVLISRNTKRGGLYQAPKAQLSKISALRYFRVDEEWTGENGPPDAPN